MVRTGKLQADIQVK
jgi:dynein heavy chain 2, cytosolic